MTSIIIIGATLSAYNFFAELQENSNLAFSFQVLEPGSTPSYELRNKLDSSQDNFDLVEDLEGLTRFSCGGDCDLRFKNVQKYRALADRVLIQGQGNLTVGDTLIDNFPSEKYSKEYLNLYNRKRCLYSCDSSLYEVTLDNFNTNRKKFRKYFKNSKSVKVSKGLYESFQKKTLYNKHIKRINYGSDNDDVVIECADGSTYHAQYVLYTLPLGVLKNSYKYFYPPLQGRKINAIQGFCTTSTNQITLEFARSIKNCEQYRDFLWLQPNVQELEGTNLEWLLGIPGFYLHSKVDTKLIGFNIGHYSRQMENQTDDEIENGIKFLLRHFYKNLPELVAVKITRINSDPSYMGGISFECVASDLFEATRQDLAAPAFTVNRIPKVLFSGEHTSTDSSNIDTGRREAQRLQQILSQSYESPCTGNVPLSPANLKFIKSVDVLVLGAGSAGIAAARYLEKNSTLEYLVLEGYSQHGGRTRNVPMINVDPSDTETKTVFAGAQWLHAVNNPLYNFAAEKNLLVSPDSLDGVGRFYREDGYAFDYNFTDMIAEFADEKLFEAEKYSDGIVPYPENLQVFLRGELEKFIKDFPDEDKVKARQVLAWHELFHTIDWASPEFKQISARTWGNYKMIDDSYENKNLKEGAWGLLRDMIADIGGHQFLYNKIVTKIYWSRGVKLLNGKIRKVLVKIADGTIYASDAVIPTFSLGVLKHDGNSLFLPSIPRRHANFIDCSGFFSISKFFIEFPYRWYDDEIGFNYVYSNPDPRPDEWRVWVNGFDKVFALLQNTLLGWAGGYGQYQLEKYTDREIVDTLVSDMRNKFLSKTNFTIPDPIRYYISHWLRNPLTRGCYSFPSAKCDVPLLGQKDLIRPIRETRLNYFEDNGQFYEGTGTPVLLFAGEGASELYFSTLHGAHYTGMDQARSVIESLSANKNNK